MRPIPCFKTRPSAGKCFDRRLSDGGSGKYPVRDVIFSVGARNDSRVLSLMSALPVNGGSRAKDSRCGGFAFDRGARDRVTSGFIQMMIARQDRLTRVGLPAQRA